MTLTRRCFLLILAAVFPAAAGSARPAEGAFVDYRPDLPAGARCRIAVSILHPTQFAVGWHEVALRTDKLREKKASALDKYLREHIAPIVIGPGPQAYIVDHHHLARILTDSGLASTLYAEVRENWSTQSPDSFWTNMAARSWVYPYDENGCGPLSPTNLPARIADMKDDPYRSLAWLVRHAGGYQETEIPFADFQWARYFRTLVRAPAGSNDWDRAVADALPLCRLPAARDLPGYSAARKR